MEHDTQHSHLTRVWTQALYPYTHVCIPPHRNLGQACQNKACLLFFPWNTPSLRTCTGDPAACFVVATNKTWKCSMKRFRIPGLLVPSGISYMHALLCSLEFQNLSLVEASSWVMAANTTPVFPKGPFQAGASHTPPCALWRNWTLKRTNRLPKTTWLTNGGNKTGSKFCHVQMKKWILSWWTQVGIAWWPGCMGLFPEDRDLDTSWVVLVSTVTYWLCPVPGFSYILLSQSSINVTGLL